MEVAVDLLKKMGLMDDDGEQLEKWLMVGRFDMEYASHKGW